VIYPLVVTRSRLAEAIIPDDETTPVRKGLASLVATPSVIAAYAGSGLQLFVCAAIPAWMPSFLNRYYGLEAGKAAVAAAGFVLVGAIGMLQGGMINDRICRKAPARAAGVAFAICAGGFGLLTAGFLRPVGPIQLMMVAAGLFVAAGVTGPAGAMVANLTDPKSHGSAFATLTLANNFLGLAPGAFVTGLLADRLGGLLEALQLIPLTCLAAPRSSCSSAATMRATWERGRDQRGRRGCGAGSTAADALAEGCWPAPSSPRRRPSCPTTTRRR